MHEIIRVGEEQVEASGEVDFFAKFGDDLTEDQRKADGYFLMGLGYLGKSDLARAKDYFEKSVSLDVSQLWGKVYLDELTKTE